MCDAWLRGHDPAFTRVLAEHRLIGLTWPPHLGGRGVGNTDRLVVTEELLRAGAPVAAHWIADRQIGPAILRHGTPELQREYLPRIAAGEVTFCLGMSESGSGSDLAALLTKAVRDGDAFRITGTKIWTSHAHRSTHAYVLARTDDQGTRQSGLTEFVVDLATPGIEVRPIYDLAGEHHFNEVHFDDVVVPEANVIGTVGEGWRQVTEQLAFERGGMERVLSTYPLLDLMLGAGDLVGEEGPDPVALGGLVCRLSALRAMAHAVAQAMDAGEAPTHRSALLKYLGNAFEGDVVELARDTVAASPDPGAGGLEGLLAGGVVSTPGTTLRGGATEVLLTIIGRQELTQAGTRQLVGGADDLRAVVDDVVGDRPRQDDPAALGALWQTAVQLGWTGIGVPEALGGSGGDLRDLAVVATSLGRHGQSAPVVETALAARALAVAGNPVHATTPAVLALFGDARLEAGVLSGQVTRVPWARHATTLVVAAVSEQGEVLVSVPLDSPGVEVSAGHNLAGEPRDSVTLVDVLVPADAILGGPEAVDAARSWTSLLCSASVLGALQAAASSATAYAQVREQFGKPLAMFQAVSHSIARMAAEATLTEVAVQQGLTAPEETAGWRVAAAQVVAARAATVVAKAAHQVVGAMGVTHEHDLHLATLRLWAWRDDPVAQRTLERRVGQAALASGRDITWDWCVQESDALGAAVRSPWSDR
jgi:alkylation response protein AidB-like acyl-CoA dehydrogenase